MKQILALVCLLAPLAAQADPLPGAQSNVTLKLTQHSSELVTDTDTKYTTKLIKYSYGNREFLSDLLAEGLLGEGEVLAGWKLVVVDSTPLVENDGNTLNFYAVKSGRTPIQIPSSRLGLSVENPAGADGISETFKDGELTSRKTSFKALVGVSGGSALDSLTDSYDNSFSLSALASGSDSVVKRTLKEDNVSYVFMYNLLGAVTLSPVLGTVTDHLSEDEQTPVEGSITFSAFNAIDIQNYPNVDTSSI